MGLNTLIDFIYLFYFILFCFVFFFFTESYPWSLHRRWYPWVCLYMDSSYGGDSTERKSPWERGGERERDLRLLQRNWLEVWKNWQIEGREQLWSWMESMNSLNSCLPALLLNPWRSALSNHSEVGFFSRFPSVSRRLYLGKCGTWRCCWCSSTHIWEFTSHGNV